jgi:hypothetical protein
MALSQGLDGNLRSDDINRGACKVRNSCMGMDLLHCRWLSSVSKDFTIASDAIKSLYLRTYIVVPSEILVQKDMPGFTPLAYSYNSTWPIF